MWFIKMPLELNITCGSHIVGSHSTYEFAKQALLDCFFQGLLGESITLFAQLYSSGYKLLCKRLLQCNMHKTFKRYVIITMQAIRFLNMINFMHFVRFVSLHNFFAFYTWYEINLTFDQLLLPCDDFVAEISLLVIPGADFALKFNYSMHKLRKTYYSLG